MNLESERKTPSFGQLFAAIESQGVNCRAMPQLSQRATDMPASPIRKLAPLANAAKARGVEVIHLNIGQPDVPSPREFFKAVKSFDEPVLAYSPSEGLPELLDAAAASYRDMGIDVTREQVMVTTAGSEALQIGLMAALNPGDEVIVPEPMYANYIGFAVAAGVKVVPLPTRIEDNFALPAAEAFEAKITAKTRAILICNPNNPTGAVYTRDQLEALRELALCHDLFLMVDEAYRDFNYTGEPITSVMQLEGLEQHAIMVDTVSKRYSLCGARIGFLVSRNTDLMAAALKFAQARLSPPTLEQIGMLGAIQTPASYFEEMRDEYEARRDVVVAAVSEIPGAFCPRIDGAFYATIRLPIDDADRFAAWMLSDFADQNQTVMFAPASGFYATPGLGRDEIRIAYVLGREKLTRAMEILQRAVAAYQT